MGAELDNSQIGSVGHLVGASMETAGHYMQGVVLQAFDRGLGSSLGVLLFTVAAVVAISSVALGGSYRLSRWFLVGPIIFFALTSPRVESSGARWLFGERVGSAQSVRAGAADSIPVTHDGKTVSVAFAFSLWNRLVSSTVQSVVTVIGATNDNSDIDFITRAERFEALFNAQVTDSTVKRFIQEFIIRKCGAYYLLKREYNSFATDFERQNWVYFPAMEERGKLTVGSTRDMPEILSMVRELKAEKAVSEFLSPEVLGAQTDVPLRCGDLWNIALLILRERAEVFISEIAESMRSPQLSRAEAERILRKKFDKKLATPYKDKDNKTVEIKVTEDQQLIFMINQVAARMFLSELQKANPDLIRGKAGFNRVPVDSQLEGTFWERVGDELLLMQKTETWVGKGNFLTAMLALPHVQGFILYWLAITYPLFALATVMPGRHGAIFVWMGLWLWVKLWDVLFAVVMVVERVLYALLPEPTPLDNKALMDPGQTIKSLMEADLGYNQHIYYNLMATLMAAVPLLSGLVVRRGGQQVVDFVGDRLSTFSGRVGYAMASHSRSLAAQTFARRAHVNAHRATEMGLWNALKNPEIQNVLSDAQVKQLQAAVIQGGGDFADIEAAVTKTLSDASFAQVRSMITNEIQMAAYYESTMPHNRYYADLAVSLTYYSHDFVQKYPRTELEVELSKLPLLGGVMQTNLVKGAASAEGMAVFQLFADRFKKKSTAPGPNTRPIAPKYDTEQPPDAPGKPSQNSPPVQSGNTSGEMPAPASAQGSGSGGRR